MARSPHRREDLLADATAMPVRGEFRCVGEPDMCVIGFRRSGAVSLYFGEQPVLHFDAAGRLRRLFYENQQILAAQGKMQLRSRVGQGPRMEGKTTNLPPDQQHEILSELTPRMGRLLLAIRRGEVRWGRTTIASDAFTRQISDWCQVVGETLRIGDL